MDEELFKDVMSGADSLADAIHELPTRIRATHEARLATSGMSNLQKADVTDLQLKLRRLTGALKDLDKMISKLDNDLNHPDALDQQRGHDRDPGTSEQLRWVEHTRTNASATLDQIRSSVSKMPAHGDDLIPVKYRNNAQLRNGLLPKLNVEITMTRRTLDEAVHQMSVLAQALLLKSKSLR